MMKVDFWIQVQRQLIHRTVEWFSTFQTLGDILYPEFWLVESRSFHCAMYLLPWTLYPKINFQPIRTCLTCAQIRGMTVGHVSFRWTCIALHSVRTVFSVENSTEQIFCQLDSEINAEICQMVFLQISSIYTDPGSELNPGQLGLWVNSARVISVGSTRRVNSAL